MRIHWDLCTFLFCMKICSRGIRIWVVGTVLGCAIPKMKITNPDKVCGTIEAGPTKDVTQISSILLMAALSVSSGFSEVEAHKKSQSYGFPAKRSS